jgi:hypothetical protein
MLSPLFFVKTLALARLQPNKKPFEGMGCTDVAESHAQCKAEDVQPAPAIGR